MLLYTDIHTLPLRWTTSTSSPGSRGVSSGGPSEGPPRPVLPSTLPTVVHVIKTRKDLESGSGQTNDQIFYHGFRVECTTKQISLLQYEIKSLRLF